MKSALIAAIGALLAVAILGALEWRARSNVVSLGFWFDADVTYELHDPARLGGPLTEDERACIRSVARAEVERAFSEFRVRVTDSPDAFYRVAVRQAITVNRRYAAAGQSHVFGPLGGAGAVSFVTLAAQAMAHAPEGATRDEVVKAIGRGIGRAAVHEFVHQLLPRGPVHSTQDRASYEYWSSDRPAQFWGDMHWDVAYEALRERIGR